MSREVDITDIGPIEHLRIPIPDGGGVVVLRGRQGVGKSHALEAINVWASGRGKLVSRDGSGGGTVSGVGVRITVGRRTSVSGELECEALEGIDPSLLVDPRVKDPLAADGVRIKALCRLARAEIQIADFAELVGGDEQLRELCRPSSLEEADVPTMAARIKADFEKAARDREQKALKLGAQADAAKVAAGGEDVADTPLQAKSAELARAAHTEAVRAQAALLDRKRSNEAIEQLARTAAEALAGIEGGSEAALQQVVAQRDAVAEQLRDARELVTRLEGQHDAAVLAVTREERTLKERNRLSKKVADAASIQPVSDEDVVAMEKHLGECSAELERWLLRERHRRQLEEAVELAAQAARARGEAENLRVAARSTERVLLAAVQKVCPEGMEIRDGRMLLRTDRGLELVSELSTGERYRLALDVAVRALGEGAVLAMEQSAWQDLDPDNRREVAQMCRERKIALIAAQVDDGPLRAETIQ